MSSYLFHSLRPPPFSVHWYELQIEGPRRLFIFLRKIQTGHYCFNHLCSALKYTRHFFQHLNLGWEPSRTVHFITENSKETPTFPFIPTDYFRLKCMLTMAEVFLEPVSIDRWDDEHHDTMTVIYFTDGKALIWEAICNDSFGNSNLTANDRQWSEEQLNIVLMSNKCAGCGRDVRCYWPTDRYSEANMAQGFNNRVLYDEPNHHLTESI